MKPFPTVAGDTGPQHRVPYSKQTRERGTKVTRYLKIKSFRGGFLIVTKGRSVILYSEEASCIIVLKWVQLFYQGLIFHHLEIKWFFYSWSFLLFERHTLWFSAGRNPLHFSIWWVVQESIRNQSLIYYVDVSVSRNLLGRNSPIISIWVSYLWLIDEFMMYLKSLDGRSWINRHYCNPLLSRKATGVCTATSGPAAQHGRKSYSLLRPACTWGLLSSFSPLIPVESPLILEYEKPILLKTLVAKLERTLFPHKLTVSYLIT